MHDAVSLALFRRCRPQQTLDDILQAVMDDPAGASGQQLCPEAAEILLELVKVIMTLVGRLSTASPAQLL